MAIIINIVVMLAKRKIRITELAEKVGIPMANVSILKTAKPELSGHKPWRRSAKRWNVSLEIFSNTRNRKPLDQLYGVPWSIGFVKRSPDIDFWRAGLSRREVRLRNSRAT